MIIDVKVFTQDARIKHDVKERYIEHWQESRGEQNLTSIKKSEIQLSNSVKWYRRKYDDEQRIHYELELINNLQVNVSCNLYMQATLPFSFS